MCTKEVEDVIRKEGAFLFRRKGRFGFLLLGVLLHVDTTQNLSPIFWGVLDDDDDVVMKAIG